MGIRRRELLVLPIVVPFAAHAQPRRDEPRLAIRGYDTVAYFTLSRPTKGDPGIGHVWDGGKYLFVSERHRQLFAADPAKYAPQFESYCTSGVTAGVKIEAEPEYWIISDGRLFLFSGAGGPDRMRADTSTAPRADENWPKLR